MSVELINFDVLTAGNAKKQSQRYDWAESVEDHRQFVGQYREPFTFDLWRKMLEPLFPVGQSVPAQQNVCDNPEHDGTRQVDGLRIEPSRTISGKKPQTINPQHDSGLRYMQIIDHRMATMSYIGVPDPRAIREGDWMRLAWLNSSGDSSKAPYAPGFLRGRDQFPAVCYDRYWSADYSGMGQAWQNTRWLCCGYGFTGVGDSRSDFFSKDARVHFRHHYFKMALIAQFHLASLLNFEQQTAQEIEKLDVDSRDERRRQKFEEELNLIQQRLVRFRSQFWFAEVTNQVQGREIFDMFCRHLGTRKLCTEVCAEINDAAEIVHLWNDRKQSDSGSRLTVLGIMFVVLMPLADSLFKGVTPTLTKGCFCWAGCCWGFVSRAGWDRGWRSSVTAPGTNLSDCGR